MTIPLSSPAAARSALQQELAPGCLGIFGNLRYSPAQGGTARARRPGVLAQLHALWTNVKFLVGRVLGRARAQRDSVSSVRENSRRIGNLLGSLTALAGDARARPRIVQALSDLAELSGGDLGMLPGAQESLDAYLDELQHKDILALCGGALGQPHVFEAVLNQVSSDIRPQSAEVLEQVKTALHQVKAMRNQQLARKIAQEPMERVAELLSSPSVDRKALAEQLMTLHAGVLKLGYDKSKGPPISQTLDFYLQSLPKESLQDMLSALRPERLNIGKELLSNVGMSRDESQAFGWLEYISQSLEREKCRRIQAELQGFNEALNQLGQAEKRLTACKVLCELNDLLEQVEQTGETAPEDLPEQARQVVRNCLSLLRDGQGNPDGPLTEDSLRKLDDAALINLRNLPRLRPLGLELVEPADAGRRRRQVLEWQVIQGIRDAFRVLSGDPVDMRAFMRQMRDLSDLELQRVQMPESTAQSPSEDEASRLESVCKQALEELYGARMPRARSLSPSNIHALQTVETMFAQVTPRLKKLIASDDYEVGGAVIMKHLHATRQLLSGMRNVLADMCAGDEADYSFAPPSRSAPDAMSGVLQRSLLEQYGVVYDPEKDEVAVPVTDSMRRLMVKAILEKPFQGAEETAEIVLPVNGVPKTYSAHISFVGDAHERNSICLSVRGAGADGRFFCFTWPKRDMAFEERKLALGGALDVLDQVAPGSLEGLTRLLNQQIGCRVLGGLHDMGEDQPYRLQCGTRIQPMDGQTSQLYDVQQNEDGSFRIHVKYVFEGFTVGLATWPNAMAGSIKSLDPDVFRWIQFQFTVDVSPDAAQMVLVEPPQFRYHLEQEAEGLG